MTSPIFQPWNENFGDQWATLSLMARRAVGTGERVRLSRWQHGTNLGPLHDSIRAVMQPMNVESVDAKGDTTLDGFDVWACDPWPTWKRWDWTARSPYAVYQFDGLSTPELKNPPLSDIPKLTHTVLASGHEIRAMGKNVGVARSVELAAGAAFFVGVDSGMSHLCHSVGVPIFLLQYQLGVVTCHRGKAYRLCEGADDFTDKLSRWLHYRTFCGLQPPPT